MKKAKKKPEKKLITSTEEVYEIMSKEESGTIRISEKVADEIITKIESFKFLPEDILKDPISTEEFEKQLLKKMRRKLLAKPEKIEIKEEAKKLLEEKFKEYKRKKNK